MADRRQSVEGLLPFLSEITEAMSEAVIAIDQQRVVVAANHAAVELLDLDNVVAALRPFADYDQFVRSWRVGDQPFAPEELGRVLAGQTIPRRLAKITTSAGVERVIQFTATPIRDEQRHVMLAMLIASDVTLEERGRAYWQAVGTAASGLSTELEVDRILESSLDQMVEALGAEVVLGIWRLEIANQRLVLMAHRGLAKGSATTLGSLPLDSPSLICEAARTGKVKLAHDVKSNPPRYYLDRRLIADERLGSWIAAPLLAGRRLIGAMCYGMRAPRRFYEDDLRAVEVIAGLFAVSIDHALLHQESQEARRRLEESEGEMREINQQLLVASVREQELGAEAEAARERMAAALEEQRRAEELREEYVSLISHDLRTPLTPVMGQASWLQKDLVNKGLDREARSAEAILTNARRMNAMIQDLVETSRLESGRTELNREPVDVCQLIAGLSERIGTAEERQRLEMDCPEGVPPAAADREQIERAITNLITNAFKYSEPTTIVAVRVEHRGSEVLVSVADQGVGIPPEELPHLFERFFRATTSRSASGTGLGLYITRLIVEAHGGRAWVESEVGKGSRFYITIPVTPPRQPKPWARNG